MLGDRTQISEVDKHRHQSRKQKPCLSLMTRPSTKASVWALPAANSPVYQRALPREKNKIAPSWFLAESSCSWQLYSEDPLPTRLQEVARLWLPVSAAALLAEPPENFVTGKRRSSSRPEFLQCQILFFRSGHKDAVLNRAFLSGTTL